MTNKIAFITGATAGIGEATAKCLAPNFRLILCGRRKERLESLQKELKQESYILSFDISKRNEVHNAISSLPENWQNIDILINNAGNAHGLTPIHQGSIEDWEAMIDINIKGLLYVSRKIIPGMVERKSGQIINIGSIAAKEVYPNGNVYCASKYAVDAITQGMRQDLNTHGIRVTAVHPGLVKTEFSTVRFKGDKEKADKVYRGFEPLTGKDIAEVVEFVINRPKHVVLSDIVVLPTAQANATMVYRQS